MVVIWTVSQWVISNSLLDTYVGYAARLQAEKDASKGDYKLFSANSRSGKIDEKEHEVNNRADLRFINIYNDYKMELIEKQKDKAKVPTEAIQP